MYPVVSQRFPHPREAVFWTRQTIGFLTKSDDLSDLFRKPQTTRTPRLNLHGSSPSSLDRNGQLNWRQIPAFPGTLISSHVSIVGEIPIVDGHIPMFVGEALFFGCLEMSLSTA